MSSHSSSHSSLLQINRPEALIPQSTTSVEKAQQQQQAQAQWLEQHEHTQQQNCRSKTSSSGDGSSTDLCLEAQQQQDDTTPQLSQSPQSLSPSSSQSQPRSQSRSSSDNLDQQPVASSSSGLNYLNMEPTSSSCIDYATADLPSPLSECPDNRQMCAEILASAQPGVMGEVIDRSKWQPDADSALCTYPLCTANFAQPTYFFLGPRRHHCRMCGQLFCSTHSSTKASLVITDNKISGKRRIVKERVCDLCCSKSNPEDDFSLSSSSSYNYNNNNNEGSTKSNQQSRRNSSCTDSDQHSDLITPYDEDSMSHSQQQHVISHSGISLRSQSSKTSTPTNQFGLAPQDDSELAPIEDWMDRSGVLSLYPLAVNPSHSSRSKRSKSPAAPAAGPLFSPSISMRREAKEKELERLTLRQRRLGMGKTTQIQIQNHDDFWLPGQWGFRSQNMEEASEGQQDKSVLNGIRRVITPLTTPNGGPITTRA
ncbi:uncharacterized protein IL334_000681 [Kwoniella shivajii]|uniref:FYVE-type domain-containing protein n=1 Tax=Kwoniella shivajii TaxID=564305 RepID=A0ABZ1CSV2_9TREE|nr:hypothetical protein IL334_000681 [Kwoniella shivajii]